ncbi:MULTISPECIES: hypothetical protein [Sorangium]|uniref:STAS domain-containing protein n=1 Tax=Sorangium cellulosum TaxID=56 RepID=A0A4P2R1Z5_SORCE|nr:MULTISPECIES: hypothetical protein [Sorangium]AUX36960.1 uncharacterized protein SOCE836_091790 [Sorangium cellulosum]WCQ96254.1 hypothetical protein NQZ70_09039 [Sorangium sp. Soce836]
MLVSPLPVDVRHESDRGSIEISYPGRHLIYYRLAGHIDASLVPGLVKPTLHAMALHGHIDEFVDCTRMTGYDSIVRVRMVEYLRAARERGSVLQHVLVGAKIVALGVWLAKLAAGGIEIYHDRAAFEAALGRALYPG